MAAVSTMVLAGAAIAAPIIGGIIGNMNSQKDRDAASAAANRAMARIDAVGAPPDQSHAILLEEFKNAGILTPELENEITQKFSEVANIQEDSSLKDAQKGALEILQQRGRTGLAPEDRAALNQVRDEVARDGEAKRQQIIQNYQARGMGGSGAEMMAQLQQAQSSSNQGSMEGDRLAAQASAQALQSMTQAGGLAGDVRRQDFDVNKTKADAMDQMNRFNVENQIARQNNNVNRLNSAQQYNLQTNQRLSDMNTSAHNDEKLRQSTAKRDFWKDKLSMATGQAAQDNNSAARSEAAADRTAAMWAGIGSGVGTGLSGMATASMKYGKKDVTPTQGNTVATTYNDDDEDIAGVTNRGFMRS